MITVLLTSCSERKAEVRSYREIVIEAPAHVHQPETAEQPAATGTKKHLTWTCPDGWTEQPGNNMRLATFLVGPDKIECTIVSFPGDAGGVKANVKRWLGQLTVEIADDVLDAFLKKQPATTTQGGLPCTIFDFSELTAARGGASMLAGMAAAGSETVFVKLMGPGPLLASEKERFLQLCESLGVTE
ncbi:MAG TPA: hypothetical protein VIH35_02040 [Kiritimatiellia bacterium]|jgi:hypothetical protein